MNIIIHPAEDRGVGEHGWLHTRYSFSFADWYDPRKMGFGKLRVLNDDVIDPHSGFGAHPHANMEIVTIVRKGAVSHKDSMGNTYKVPAHDVQVMSAGTGVVHSEYNNEDEPLELFQIWIEPMTKNIAPRYAQKSFGVQNTYGAELLVSPDGREGSLSINQDAFISRIVCDDKPFEYVLKNPEHGAYIFVVEGVVKIDGDVLNSRDALGLQGVEKVSLESNKAGAEILIFEVPFV